MDLDSPSSLPARSQRSQDHPAERLNKKNAHMYNKNDDGILKTATKNMVTPHSCFTCTNVRKSQ